MRNNNFNFQVLQDLVNTQYGDMAGLIQIDGHSGLTELYALCEQNGITRDEYFIIGFGFSEFTTNGLGTSGAVSCSVLLLETQKYASSFDEIRDQLVINPKVDVIRKLFHIPYKDLRKYIKRVDALMMTDLGNYIHEMNIIDVEDV